jgi:superfamily II DNA/RNA helicase
MVVISNAGRLGTLDGNGNPLCAAFDDVLAGATQRLWLVMPWVYTRDDAPWLLGFIDRFALAARRGLDVRAYLRPDPANSHAVAVWQAAGVNVVQVGPRVQHLHSKLLVTDSAALVGSANLTDTDLFRNVNHLTIEHEPTVVADWANSVLLLHEPAPPAIFGDGVDTASVVPANLRRYLPAVRLNPMQAQAVPHVLHSDGNLVIASPTGSGKTLVAEVAVLHDAVDRNKIGVYLTPMRTIASEKYKDWRLLETLGLRVYKTTGEDDAFDAAQAAAAHIIIATPEKWDSISRSRLPQRLVERIGTIVVDEVHVVDEPNRGPGLEAMLARLHLAFPAARLIAMSGTLLNADVIARWLHAELIESAWRPIALTNIVVPYPETGVWQEDEGRRNALATQIVGETLAASGAALVFCGSRKGVESCARYLGDALDLPHPTLDTVVRNVELRSLLAQGVAFHHAGLDAPDRRAVEDLFRSGAIKALVATTTVAAGVNLPARVVVVRDLHLGPSEISAHLLLQMAGRAGRPGQETEGRCYVIAPSTGVARTEAMLGGRPILSRLGDDLVTHLNTEVALDIVRSRAMIREWYARTLHAQLAPEPVNLDEPLQYLLDHGFVREVDGVLVPTDLGKTTMGAMIRVSSAVALDQFLAERTARPADPETLEWDLLVAASGLPTELANVTARKGDEAHLTLVADGDARLKGWTLGRVLYLAVAASRLSGVPAEQLPVEGASSVAAAVQTDIPRFLRFLARRADQRNPSSPEVLVAAADLAAALEYGVAERGAGMLLQVLRQQYPADDTRRRKVLADYRALRDRAVDGVQSAGPYLKGNGRAYADAIPQNTPSIEVCDGRLVARLGTASTRVRAHVRLVTKQREMIQRVDTADPREVPLVRLEELGGAGATSVDLEVLLRGSALSLWSYGQCGTEVTVPRLVPDFAAADRLLRVALQVQFESATSKTWLQKVAERVRGEIRLADLEQQLVTLPACVRDAAAVLAAGLVTPADKADAVRALVERRRHAAQLPRREPRSLSASAGADDLTYTEAALLAAALLRAMGVEAQLFRATYEREEGAFCAWRHDARWYGLPLHAEGRTRIYDVEMHFWDGEPEPQAARVGWQVIQAYERIAPRRLPFVLPNVSARGGEGPLAADSGPPPPACPTCEGRMRQRSGPRGLFWGCERFPVCRGTRPIDDGLVVPRSTDPPTVSEVPF